MRTALIFTVLFTSWLLDCAYSAPLADTDAVLQEILSVMEQAKTSKPTPKPQANKPKPPQPHANTSKPRKTDTPETRTNMADPHTKINFLCEIVGKVAVDIRTIAKGHLKSQFLTQAGVHAALDVAQAIHSAGRLQHPRIEIQEQEQTEAISLACLATGMRVVSHSPDSNKNTTVHITSPKTEQRS